MAVNNLATSLSAFTPSRFKASNPGGSIETFELSPNGLVKSIADWRTMMEPFGFKFLEELPAMGAGVGPTGAFAAPAPPAALASTLASYPALPGPTVSIDPNAPMGPQPNAAVIDYDWGNTPPAALPPPVPSPQTPPAPQGLPATTTQIFDGGNRPLGQGTLASISPSSQNAGTLTEDEYRRLVNSGTLPPGDTRPVVQTYGNPASDPSAGNQGVTAPGLPSDFTDALRQLIQEARNQGLQGQEAYEGVTNDLRSFLDFTRQSTTQNMGKQDDLINSLMAKINPALGMSMGLMNQSEGLSPEAKSAMNTQATEGSQRDYLNQVQSLKTELLRSGAAGGLDPAALDSLVRGYGNLQASRDAATAKGRQDTILADEQRKFESLGLNRDTAMQGLNTAAGLTGTLGSVYNPGQFLGAAENALGGLTGIVGAKNAQAQDALRTAGSFAGTLADNQPGSMSNLLKSALLSTGFATLQDLITGGTKDQIGGLLGKVLGGGNGGDTPPSIPGGTGPAKTVGAGVGAALATAAPIIAAIAGLVYGGKLVTQGIGQGRDMADAFVEKVQNPFGKALGSIVDGYNADAAKGTLTKQEAEQGLKAVQDLWKAFNDAGKAFSGEEEGLSVIEKAARANARTAVEQAHRQLDPLMAQIMSDMQAKMGGLNA